MPAADKPKPLAGSIATLRIFGIPVRLHFTFVLLLIFLVLLGVGGRQSGAFLALYILGLVLSMLLHEIGHTLMARRYGIGTVEIVMFPMGGIARSERPPQPREELWIALAGPLVNLLLGMSLLAWVAAQQGLAALEQLWRLADTNLAERIALGNLVLFVVNLIPATPMDGGRILRSLLARHQPEEQATRLVARAGQILAALLALAGLFWNNFFLVFVALFVYLGAAQEGSLVRRRILTTGFPVRAAMITDFRTLQHGATIQDAGNLLLTTSQSDFPVMHGNTVTGLLTRRRLVRAMLREGPGAYVAGAMDREFPRLLPDTPLKEVLTQVSTPGACALVIDAENRLLGMVTSKNVSEFLLLRQAKMLQPES